MKYKFLLFVGLFFIAFLPGRAQISKGSIFLGGQISFNSQSTTYSVPGVNDQKYNSFNFSPAIGKAIKDNMVVGVDLNYNHFTNKQGNISADQTNDVFGAGVFMRRYVPLGKGFYVFGQGRFGASYNTGKTIQGQPPVTDNIKGYSFEFGFYPGISYQVSKRLHLETGFNNLGFINYTHSKDTQTGPASPMDSKTNSFSIGSSLNNLASFTLGFRMLLSK